MTMTSVVSSAALLRDAAARLRAAGIEDARLEAELLLAHALGVARLDVLTAAPDAPARAAPDALRAFGALLERRARRIPLAHLTGRREFYGRPFAVTPAVLVPRPETEMLVQVALERLQDFPGGSDLPVATPGHRGPKPAPTRGSDFPACPERGRGVATPGTPRLLDVGTGSGCLAVTLACECPAARIVATDVSRDALAVARANAARHGVADRICFLAGDLFSSFFSPDGCPAKNTAGNRPFDLIVSNPPYIPDAELVRCMPEVRDHEPRAALEGGPDGLRVIRRLLAEAPDHLAPGGAVIIEVGAGQAEAAIAMAENTGYYRSVRAARDLTGAERVVAGFVRT